MKEITGTKKQTGGMETYSCYRAAMAAGDFGKCLELTPFIAVTKDKRFLPLLRDFLDCGDRKVQELAVCGLAALGDPAAAVWLIGKFEDSSLYSGSGCRKLQTALIDAIGEIGDDSSTPGLLAVFGRLLPRDSFRRGRRVIVVEALGAIAQQGGPQALAALTALLDHEDFLIRAHAITHLCTSFWQRPDDLPEEIIEKLLSLFRDSNLFVHHALISALENLADLGCRRVAELFSD